VQGHVKEGKKHESTKLIAWPLLDTGETKDRLLPKALLHPVLLFPPGLLFLPDDDVPHQTVFHMPLTTDQQILKQLFRKTDKP
jgi:hypothetical protein